MNNRLILAAACCVLLGTGSGALADDQRGRGRDDNPGLDDNPGRGRDDPPGLDDNPGRGKGLEPKLTKTILDFHTMVGVNGLFLGDSNPIRGVNGGGRPWVLEDAQGRLKDNGKLEVEVQGLVIPATDALPSFCNGIACNPAPFFKAVVSCLTVENGFVVEDNIITENGSEVMIGDPKAGNAKIEAMLDLPKPCIAPIIFITNDKELKEISWFAITGVGAIQ